MKVLSKFERRLADQFISQGCSRAADALRAVKPSIVETSKPENIESTAMKQLARPHVKGYIEERLAEISEKGLINLDLIIADIFSTRDHAAQHNDTTNRLRANEMLAKLAGGFSDKLILEQKGDSQSPTQIAEQLGDALADKLGIPKEDVVKALIGRMH